MGEVFPPPEPFPNPAKPDARKPLPAAASRPPCSRFSSHSINTIRGDGQGLTNLNAAQLRGTVSPNNIAASTISGAMLAVGAVGANHLADGAVTAAKVTTVTVPGSYTTLTNPAPTAYDMFGSAVAAVGTDRMLVGAPGGDAGVGGVGAAHLFSTDGTLLTTFTSPTLAIGDYFGVSVTAVGTDRVLIGARDDNMGATGAGAAYLFSTNGTLLTTFTNPTPAAYDHFGISAATVGTDRVLIGARDDNMGATGAGAAYLFSVNGALLTTFTNPAPTASDCFGIAVAALGTDRVLIGARDDRGGFAAGAAYLFSINGALLTTFTNPAPSAFDYFGSSLAVVGSNRLLIGAPGDDTGGSEVGARIYSAPTVRCSRPSTIPPRHTRTTLATPWQRWMPIES